MKYPEYRDLRARSRSMARVWQFGHAAVALSPFSIFGAAVVAASAFMDLNVGQEQSPWPVVAALLLWAVLCIGVGLGLMRYAIRKAGMMDTESQT